MTDANQTAATPAKVGIEETKKVMKGLEDLAVDIIKIAKEGIAKGASDIVADILAHPSIKQELTDAVSAIKDVPAEIKDLDLGEGVALIEEIYIDSKPIIDALKA